MTDDDRARLRRLIGRGRGVPWISIVVFVCCLALLATWAVSPQAQEGVDDNNLAIEVPIFAAFGGGVLLLVVLVIYLFRVRSIRQAALLESRDSDVLSLVCANSPALAIALRGVADADDVPVTRVSNWFCATVSNSGITLWGGAGEPVAAFEWGWDRIAMLRKGVVASGRAVFSALMVVVTTRTGQLEVPIVVQGRGPAGDFAQRGATIDLLVEWCENLTASKRPGSASAT